MCDCSQQVGRALDLCTGQGHDGRPDPAQRAVQAWYIQFCLPEPREGETLQVKMPTGGTVTRTKLPPFLFGDGPSAGLGDTVAKVLIWSRLKEPAVRAIKWWFKTTDCGCRARQAAWNKRWPWPEWWRASVGTWLRRWI